MLIIPGECQVALTLSHYLRIVVDPRIRSSAFHPLLGEWKLVSRAFQRRVDRRGNDQCILRRQFVCFLIRSLRAIQLALRGVEIAKSKVGDVIVWIKLLQLQEVFLRGTGIVQVARQVTECCKRGMISGIIFQRILVCFECFLLTVRFPQQICVIQLDVDVIGR